MFRGHRVESKTLHLLRRELGEVCRGNRFRATAAMTLALMVFSSLIYASRYRVEIEAYEEAQASYEAEILDQNSIANFAARRHPAIKPPWRLGLLVDGQQSQVPGVYSQSPGTWRGAEAFAASASRRASLPSRVSRLALPDSSGVAAARLHSGLRRDLRQTSAGSVQARLDLSDLPLADSGHQVSCALGLPERSAARRCASEPRHSHVSRQIDTRRRRATEKPGGGRIRLVGEPALRIDDADRLSLGSRAGA